MSLIKEKIKKIKENMPNILSMVFEQLKNIFNKISSYFELNEQDKIRNLLIYRKLLSYKRYIKDVVNDENINQNRKKELRINYMGDGWKQGETPKILFTDMLFLPLPVINAFFQNRLVYIMPVILIDIIIYTISSYSIIYLLFNIILNIVFSLPSLILTILLAIYIIFHVYKSYTLENSIKVISQKNKEVHDFLWEKVNSEKEIKEFGRILFKTKEEKEHIKKEDIEDNTDTNTEGLTFTDSRDNIWYNILQRFFPKSLEDYSNPEYIDLEGTEVHVIDIPTITTEDIKKKLELIESKFKKNIYQIHKNYNNQIGSIGIEFEKYDLPKLIPLEEVPDLKNEEKIVIGKSVKEWVTWDINKSPHTLVVGATGGGKSVTMNHLINEVVKKEWLPYFIDFKQGMEFGLYEKKGYRVITEREDFVEFLEDMNEELEWRGQLSKYYEAKSLKKLNKELKKDGKNIVPRIVIFFDEFADVHAEKDDFTNDINKNMGRLLAKGRAVGIHCVIGTQRPDAKTIGEGAFRDNIECRIVGRMNSDGAWKMSFGVENLTGIERNIINKVPEGDAKQGMFIVKGTATIDGYVIVRTPFMDEDDFKDFVLSYWSYNPYSYYNIGYKNISKNSDNFTRENLEDDNMNDDDIEKFREELTEDDDIEEDDL